MGAPATPHTVTGTGAVYPNACVYKGMRIRDTSGAANTITVYDNASAASGTIIDVLQLAANESDGAGGDVNCTKGVYLQSTGAISGSVRIG